MAFNYKDGIVSAPYLALKKAQNRLFYALEQLDLKHFQK
jgi:hypothetical protein